MEFQGASLKFQTDELRKKTYWSSYNRPAYPEIQSLVGADDQISKYGDWFTHDRTARAKIFIRDHSKIKESTLCFVPSVAMFCKAFLTCSTGCLADTAASVQPNY